MYIYVYIALLVMTYEINLLLNSTILGLLTIKLFTISAINIDSLLLTSLNSATLNQFAVNSDTQSIFVLSYPALNVPNTFTAVLITVAISTASSNAKFGVHVTLLRSHPVIWTWHDILMPWLTLPSFFKSVCFLVMWHVHGTRCVQMQWCSQFSGAKASNRNGCNSRWYV